MKKLTQIQNELRVPKNQFNSFGKYKYRTCEDILEAVKPLLLKHDCTLTMNDETAIFGEVLIINSVAIFTDPQGLEKRANSQAGIDINKKGMDIAQSFGSSSSYARKAAFSGLFLLDDSKDIDASQTKKEEKKLPELTPSHTKWAGAKKAIQDGNYTVEKLKEVFFVSPENEVLLNEKV